VVNAANPPNLATTINPIYQNDNDLRFEHWPSLIRQLQVSFQAASVKVRSQLLCSTIEAKFNTTT
jgi:hypothetical protein